MENGTEIQADGSPGREMRAAQRRERTVHAWAIAFLT